MTTPENEYRFSSFNSLNDYEAWASKYWIYACGTTEAQHHARAKMDEETQELIEALAGGTPEEIISEAGDVLWTAAATGANAGIIATEVIAMAFPGYFKVDAPLHIQEIDAIASTLFDSISDKDIEEYLRENQSTLAKAAQQWFALGDSVNTPKKTFADAWIAVKREDAAHAVTMMTLLVSYIAQRYAGKNLATVLEVNYQKIETRVRLGAAVTKLPRHRGSIPL